MRWNKTLNKYNFIYNYNSTSKFQLQPLTIFQEKKFSSSYKDDQSVVSGSIPRLSLSVWVMWEDWKIYRIIEKKIRTYHNMCLRTHNIICWLYKNNLNTNM